MFAATMVNIIDLVQKSPHMIGQDDNVKALHSAAHKMIGMVKEAPQSFQST